MNYPKERFRPVAAYALICLLALLPSCTPRVELAPSDKPITINLNVKIDHEVRVKIEKDVDKLLENDDLF